MKTKEQLEAKMQERNRKNERDQKLIDSMKPVDGWYVSDGFPKWMSIVVDGMAIVGIDSNGYWDDTEPVEFIFNNGERLATKEEYTKRLTEYVDSRGYKAGVSVIGLFEGNTDKINYIRSEGDGVEFVVANDGLYFICINGTLVWRSNLGWAKIVEEKPKYKVIDFETCRNRASQSVTHTVKISGKWGHDFNQSIIKERIEELLNK